LSSKENEKRPLVYIAGALTGLNPEEADRYKRWYEGAAQICEELGFEPYLPHKHTDPVQHPKISAYEVYLTDTSKVKEARFVLAFTDVPSHGVGIELAIAAEYEKPVILMIRLGCPVSRMVLGSPSVIGAVSFSDWEQGARLLRRMIINRASLLETSLRQTEHLERIEIILPITYNNGQPVPEEDFESLENVLGRRFGGWSYAPGRGGWANHEGRRYIEEHRRYDVLVAPGDFSEEEFCHLRETLQKRFKQLEVLMLRTTATRL
jgi:nucleoside 2-deoxyribosyltransferase